MSFVKFGVQAHRCKHLIWALTKSDISYAIDICLLYDIFPKCWLVVFGHFVKWNIKVSIHFFLSTIIQINLCVSARETTASRIVEPKVVTFLNKFVAKRIFAITENARASFSNSMIVDSYFTLIVTFDFAPINSVNSVNITIFSLISMLLDWQT